MGETQVLESDNRLAYNFTKLVGPKIPCTQYSGKTTTSAPCFAAVAVHAEIWARLAVMLANGVGELAVCSGCGSTGQVWARAMRTELGMASTKYKSVEHKP